MGSFDDPYGHKWSLATHTQDLTPEQIEKGGKEWMAKMQAGKK
jgi:PhnB protein